jgi:hypothetical protein
MALLDGNAKVVKILINNVCKITSMVGTKNLQTKGTMLINPRDSAFASGVPSVRDSSLRSE